MNKAEYDPSLTQFLIDNGFTTKLVPLIPREGSWVLPADKRHPISQDLSSVIEELQREYGSEGGCIFTLPGNVGLGPWETYVFYTPISSDEIRRRVANKAFL
jgi:hypothetical protein